MYFLGSTKSFIYLYMAVLGKKEIEKAIHLIRLYPGERCYQLVFERLESAIDKEEAGKHGIVSAKYAGATANSSDARKDSDDEVAFLKSGDLDGLKARFGMGKQI